MPEMKMLTLNDTTYDLRDDSASKARGEINSTTNISDLKVGVYTCNNSKPDWLPNTWLKLYIAAPGTLSGAFAVSFTSSSTSRFYYYDQSKSIWQKVSTELVSNTESVPSKLTSLGYTGNAVFFRNGNLVTMHYDMGNAVRQGVEGTSTTIFDIPEGYRPKVQYTKFQTVGNGIGNIVYVWRITPDGKVNLQSVSSTADIATWMVDYLMWTV